MGNKISNTKDASDSTKKFAISNMVSIIRSRLPYVAWVEGGRIVVGFVEEIDKPLLEQFSWIKNPWTVSVGKSFIGQPAIIITSNQF
jgi:hypothetical protein